MNKNKHNKELHYKKFLESKKHLINHHVNEGRYKEALIEVEDCYHKLDLVDHRYLKDTIEDITKVIYENLEMKEVKALIIGLGEVHGNICTCIFQHIIKIFSINRRLKEINQLINFCIENKIKYIRSIPVHGSPGFEFYLDTCFKENSLLSSISLIKLKFLLVL